MDGNVKDDIDEIEEKNMNIDVLIPLPDLISRTTFTGLCDFTQVTAGAWATYPKNPRNLPKQSGFSAYIEWPEKSED